MADQNLWVYLPVEGQAAIHNTELRVPRFTIQITTERGNNVDGLGTGYQASPPQARTSQDEEVCLITPIMYAGIIVSDRQETECRATSGPVFHGSGLRDNYQTFWICVGRGRDFLSGFILGCVVTTKAARTSTVSTGTVTGIPVVRNPGLLPVQSKNGSPATSHWQWSAV
jgi:hypothetical protein